MYKRLTLLTLLAGVVVASANADIPSIADGDVNKGWTTDFADGDKYVFTMRDYSLKSGEDRILLVGVASGGDGYDSMGNPVTAPSVSEVWLRGGASDTQLTLIPNSKSPVGGSTPDGMYAITELYYLNLPSDAEEDVVRDIEVKYANDSGRPGPVKVSVLAMTIRFVDHANPIAWASSAANSGQQETSIANTASGTLTGDMLCVDVTFAWDNAAVSLYPRPFTYPGQSDRPRTPVREAVWIADSRVTSAYFSDNFPRPLNNPTLNCSCPGGALLSTSSVAIKGR